MKPKCASFYLFFFSLNFTKPAHLILGRWQMAERNPGIDSLSVGSPAKQNKQRQRSPSIFLERDGC